MTELRSTGPANPGSHSLGLISTSRAADAGYMTLADLSPLAAELDLDYRIVGGHMVTLLVAVYGAGTSSLSCKAGPPPYRHRPQAETPSRPLRP